MLFLCMSSRGFVFSGARGPGLMGFSGSQPNIPFSVDCLTRHCDLPDSSNHTQVGRQSRRQKRTPHMCLKNAIAAGCRTQKTWEPKKGPECHLFALSLCSASIASAEHRVSFHPNCEGPHTPGNRGLLQQCMKGGGCGLSVRSFVRCQTSHSNAS